MEQQAKYVVMCRLLRNILGGTSNNNSYCHSTAISSRGASCRAVGPKIAWHLIRNQQEYDSSVSQEQERRTQDRKRRRLYAQAHELGLRLIPAEDVP